MNIKSILLLLSITLSLLSSPMIEVDSANANLGNFREGEFKKVIHTYVIKNIGDEPLIITRVKPG